MPPTEPPPPRALLEKTVTLGEGRLEPPSDPARPASASAGRRRFAVGQVSDGAGALALAHTSAGLPEGTNLARVADLVSQGGRPMAVATARRAMRALAPAHRRRAARLKRGRAAGGGAGPATPLPAAAVVAASLLAVVLNAPRAGRD